MLERQAQVFAVVVSVAVLVSVTVFVDVTVLFEIDSSAASDAKPIVRRTKTLSNTVLMFKTLALFGTKSASRL
jgi:hypothetical protein